MLGVARAADASSRRTAEARAGEAAWAPIHLSTLPLFPSPHFPHPPSSRAFPSACCHPPSLDASTSTKSLMPSRSPPTASHERSAENDRQLARTRDLPVEANQANQINKFEGAH